MKVKKIILVILAAMFLISLVVCARDCMQYEKAVKDIASAEDYYEQLQQRDSDRAANDWNYAMNLSAGYVAQRKEAQSMIERAQERVWEREDVADALEAKTFRSTGLTILLFIMTCIFYVKAMRKKKTI